MSSLYQIATLLGFGLTLGCTGIKSSETKSGPKGPTPNVAGDPAASESKRTSTDEPSPGDGGGGADDGTVDILVPMGLWDPRSIAELIKSIPLSLVTNLDLPTLDNGNFNAAQVNFSLPTFDAANAQALATAMQNVPGAATSFMRFLLSAYAQQLHELGKVYGDEEIVIETRNGKGSTKFEVYASNLPGGSKHGYVVISYDKYADFPFTLEVYEGTTRDESTFRRLARWEFKEIDHGAISLRAQIAQPMDTRMSHFVIEYTQGVKRAWLASGTEGLTTGADRFVLEYEYSDAWAMIQGGYVVAGMPGLMVPGLPRYAAAQKGDAHIFRSLSEISPSQSDAIQELAFVPVEEATAAKYLFDASLFASPTYVDRGYESLAGFLQNSLYNPGCATTGSEMRNKLSAQNYTVPASLASAPDSFCAADKTITVRQITEIVYDICWVSLPEGSVFTVPGTLIEVDLCDFLTSVNMLSNPQRVYLNPQGERVVEVASSRPATLSAFLTRGPEGAEQQAFYHQLSKASFPDVSYLGETSWPKEIIKNKSEFAGATVLRK